ncbi:hypothetical protein FV222_00315 [Methylobacterium sp. WL103]|uniref:hypothetical protein n=1 Tax=Methylobacterium sp. WL103 TaxID=2603891 RepID=UPI0011C8EFF3|nr:hypothetical protein [Methylobacterium sp. WL103]TXN08948.1 hypothetical protein FV222_00315 [Methylobacterium sp. WL103]
MPSGHVIIIHLDNRVTVEDTIEGEPGLGQVQKAVDGYVQIVHDFDTVMLTVDLMTYMDEESVRKLKPLPAVPFSQRCICFCNEEGKVEGRPFNLVATQLWAQALMRSGRKVPLPSGGVAMDDFLVGSVALLIGDGAIKGWQS